MVDLIETLSRREVNELLEQLSQKDWRRVTSRRVVGKPTEPNKRKFGSVGDAVVQVLADANGELQMVEVHHRVEALLGESVARSSVKNCLVRGCTNKTQLFERIGRGRYRLSESRSGFVVTGEKPATPRRGHPAATVTFGDETA